MGNATKRMPCAREAGAAPVAALCVTLALTSFGCGSVERTRPARSPQQLMAARESADRELEAVHEAIMARNLERVKARQDDYAAGRADAPPVVNLLMISGGGDWGAFGAGFLKGWGQVPPGPMARPEFDGVTGVSTGALIAPFAFLGDDASYEKVARLYRSPKRDWVKPRGLLSLLRGGAAYADIPGLERELRDALDPATLRAIAERGKDGRILAVSATNIDTEEMHVWDVVKEAGAGADGARVRQILLASSAVPGVFPPREIDGTLYVDGGVTGNILYGVPPTRRANETFLDRWLRAYPDTPPPKIRYWVIFNNELRWPPEVVQPKWSSVLVKSSTAATRAATVNSMRQLFLQAQLARVRHKADVEVRVVAVPDGWVAPNPKPFDKATMNAMADMGEKMGADPSSWRTEPP
jgi:predicted acylesterase/phospholipase RssA